MERKGIFAHDFENWFDINDAMVLKRRTHFLGGEFCVDVTEDREYWTQLPVTAHFEFKPLSKLSYLNLPYNEYYSKIIRGQFERKASVFGENKRHIYLQIKFNSAVC